MATCAKPPGRFHYPTRLQPQWGYSYVCRYKNSRTAAASSRTAQVFKRCKDKHFSWFHQTFSPFFANRVGSRSKIPNLRSKKPNSLGSVYQNLILSWYRNNKSLQTWYESSTGKWLISYCLWAFPTYIHPNFFFISRKKPTHKDYLFVSFPHLQEPIK